jgi:hypothetical protein
VLARAIVPSPGRGRATPGNKGSGSSAVAHAFSAPGEVRVARHPEAMANAAASGHAPVSLFTPRVRVREGPSAYTTPTYELSGRQGRRPPRRAARAAAARARPARIRGGLRPRSRRLVRLPRPRRRPSVQRFDCAGVDLARARAAKSSKPSSEGLSVGIGGQRAIERRVGHGHAVARQRRLNRVRQPQVKLCPRCALLHGVSESVMTQAIPARVQRDVQSVKSRDEPGGASGPVE